MIGTATRVMMRLSNGKDSSRQRRLSRNEIPQLTRAQSPSRLTSTPRSTSPFSRSPYVEVHQSIHHSPLPTAIPTYPETVLPQHTADPNQACRQGGITCLAAAKVAPTAPPRADHAPGSKTRAANPAHRPSGAKVRPERSSNKSKQNDGAESRGRRGSFSKGAVRQRRCQSSVSLLGRCEAVSEGVCGCLRRR